MKKSKSIFAAVFGVLALAAQQEASAQLKGVYWATSGFAGPYPIQALIPSIPKEKQRDITVPISMWVLDHAKGLVVFDTGNNVAISDGNCKSHWLEGVCDFLKPTQKRADVIDRQLERLGYKTSDVKVVISSHAHLDHIGNITMFPQAIHVLQKKELYQAWWPEKFQRNGVFVQADFDKAREFNYMEIEGDYDLFGDGSIQILSTPGHTLGHQSLKVKLPQTGSIIISQDAIWMKENLEGYPAGLNYSVMDYTKSLNRLKHMRDLEGAQIFMSHDEDQFREKGNRWYK